MAMLNNQRVYDGIQFWYDVYIYSIYIYIVYIVGSI